jgi:hypothetical protein
MRWSYEGMIINEFENNSNLPDGYWFTQPNSDKRMPNWPHFGLRPGLFDVKKINTLPEIPDCNEFEYNFGIEYSKKYISILYNTSRNDTITCYLGGVFGYVAFLKSPNSAELCRTAYSGPFGVRAFFREKKIQIFLEKKIIKK